MVLCRVHPGTETIVYEAVREKGVYCFLCLGEYDLALLDPCSTSTIQHNDWRYEIPHIREYDELICFSTSEYSKTVDDLIARGKALAVSVVKLRQEQIKKYGIYLEIGVSSWIKKNCNNNAVETSVLGSFSWSEIVILWAADSFKAIINKMDEIRELELTGRNPNSPEFTTDSKRQTRDNATHRELVVASSHTFPCASVKTSNSREAYSNSSLVDINDQLSVNLQILAVPGYENEVAQYLINLKQVAKVSLVFGYYDLEVHPQGSHLTPEHLAEILDRVRGSHEGKILATLTTIRTDLKDENDKSKNNSGIGGTRQSQNLGSNKPNNDHFFDVAMNLQEYERQFVNRSVSFAPQLLQMIGRYERVKLLSENQGLLQDLKWFLDETIKTVETILREKSKLAMLTPELRRYYEDLWNAYPIFNYVLDQRLSGTQIGLANGTRSLTSLHASGIQRVISASRSIPDDTLTSLTGNQIRWEGLIVFGYANEIIRLDTGVINLPASSLFDPGIWWSLVHEAGHEAMSLFNLENLPEILAIMQQALRKLNLPDNNDNEKLLVDYQIDPEALVAEFVADAVALVFASDSDWTIFRDHVWDLLQDYLEGKHDIGLATQYLIRSTFIFFFFLELQGALDQNELIRDAIAKGDSLKGRLYLPPQEEMFYSDSKDSINRNIRHRGFARYSSVSEIIEQFLKPQIELSAPQISSLIRHVDSEIVSRWYEAFEPLRSSLIDLFTRMGFDPMSQKSMPNLTEVRKKLRNGKLCIEKSMKPSEIALALKQERIQADSFSEMDTYSDRNEKTIIAGILSLWHWDKINHDHQPGLPTT